MTTWEQVRVRSSQRRLAQVGAGWRRSSQLSLKNSLTPVDLLVGNHQSKETAGLFIWLGWLLKNSTFQAVVHVVNLSLTVSLKYRI